MKIELLLNNRGTEVCVWSIGDLLGPHAVITKYHRLCGLNCRLSFLTVLESGKSTVKVLADLVSGGTLFLLGLQITTCLLNLYIGKPEGASGHEGDESISPKHWVPTSWERDGASSV